MQAEFLGLVLLQPTRAWSLDELATALGAPASSVHRELLRTVNAGLATRDSRQRPHRYQAAQDAPAFRPTRDLLELTVGVPRRLREALEGKAEIRAAAIHAVLTSDAATEMAQLETPFWKKVVGGPRIDLVGDQMSGALGSSSIRLGSSSPTARTIGSPMRGGSFS